MIRHALASYRAGRLKTSPAAKRLGLSRSRFYELYGDYLKACAYHCQPTWTPSVSAGDHALDWPAEVQALRRKRLSRQPPASHSFAASEALRAFGSGFLAFLYWVSYLP